VLVEARAAAARQDLSEHRDRVVVWRQARRDAIGDVEAGQARQRVLDIQPPFPILGGWLTSTGGGGGWDGIDSKCLRARSSVDVVFTSPTMAMTALLGA
jgi:hypothetical protein